MRKLREEELQVTVFFSYIFGASAAASAASLAEANPASSRQGTAKIRAKMVDRAAAVAVHLEQSLPVADESAQQPAATDEHSDPRSP